MWFSDGWGALKPELAPTFNKVQRQVMGIEQSMLFFDLVLYGQSTPSRKVWSNNRGLIAEAMDNWKR
jgi:hypothetical protein